MKKKLSIIILLFVSYNSFATRYYVNEVANGNNNGLSWANAYTNLQSAISSAIFGDEIWVATGTYKASSVNNRDISFVMKNGVNLYGSFSGTETLLTQRDITANPTNLSGDIGALGDNSDNTKKIIKIQNITSSIIIDGFRIVSGHDGSSSGEGAGAYVYSNSGGNITFNNCLFYDNYSYYQGGAVSTKNSNIVFDKCQFLYNSSFNYGGGAIYSANVSNCNLYINSSKFIGNSSRSGAVINFDGYVLKIDKSIITNNTATTGSIVQVSDANNFTISNSLVAGNLIQSNYGASVISSYSVPANSSNLINVTVCHNRNNSQLTISDEAIYKANSAMNIYNSIVYGNTRSDINAQIDSGNNVVNSIVENGYIGTNNLNVDPLFVNPINLSAAPFDVTNFDYSLQNNSLGINSGNNTYVSNYPLDYLENTRIQETTVDRGAIESSYSLSTNTFSDKSINYFFDNGANHLHFIDLEKFLNQEVAIYNTSGKLVFKNKIVKNEMEINLTQGIYLVHIKDYKTLKIVVIH